MKRQRFRKSSSPELPGGLAPPEVLRGALSSWVIWLALGLAGVLPGAAQDEGQAFFGETVDVRVVNLEVVVEDRQGNRVPGLGAEEFQLQVDGHVVPLDYFSEVADAQAVEGSTGIPGLAPGGG